jgi:hypothetical protein
MLSAIAWKICSRNDVAVLQRVADNAIIDLGIERAVVEPDPGSAAPAFGKSLTEAAYHVCLSATLGIPPTVGRT